MNCRAAIGIVIVAVIGTAGASAQSAKTVSELYPNLVSAALASAKPAELPEGLLLRAGDLTLSQKDLEKEIAQAPSALRDSLRKNALFLLEQIATKQLLEQEARRAALQAGKDPSAMTPREMIEAYFNSLTSFVNVEEKEIQEFYEENRDAVGGRSLEEVRSAVAQFLQQQKKQKVIEKHIQTMGQRMAIEVAASWLKEQATAARDNPIDKARASGLPTLVDLGSRGCRPCEMLQPILRTLREKYEGKANILFVSVREEPILASRYGVQSIPTLIFFDKKGREFFRHVGFQPQEVLEKKLSEMGVK